MYYRPRSQAARQLPWLVTEPCNAPLPASSANGTSLSGIPIMNTPQSTLLPYTHREAKLTLTRGQAERGGGYSSITESVGQRLRGAAGSHSGEVGVIERKKNAPLDLSQPNGVLKAPSKEGNLSTSSDALAHFEGRGLLGA